MISVNLAQCDNRTTLDTYMLQGSVWEGIQGLAPFPFFDTVPPAQLDLQMGLSFGQRFMFSKLVTVTPEQMAVNIVAAYKTKWDKLIEVLAIDYDLGAGTSKKLTETINKIEARDNTRDDVNKVSAFNTEELISDTGSTSTGADNLTGDTTRTLTEADISLTNAFNNLSLLDQGNIIQTVIKDVATYMTLSVY